MENNAIIISENRKIVRVTVKKFYSPLHRVATLANLHILPTLSQDRITIDLESISTSFQASLSSRPRERCNRR